MKFPLRKLGITLVVALLTFLAVLNARRWTGWDPLELFAARPAFSDVVTRLDLELDLRDPPRLAGKARLALREGTQGRVWFLLNRDLELERACDENGSELRWENEGRLRSDYHNEARLIAVDLPGPTRELVLDYAGRGQNANSKRDWMGVLRIAPDELRMSHQTVFYPQIPRDLDGPDPLPWPTRLRVLAAPGLEAYAPGKPVECAAAPAGSREWCWESDTPGVLSLFAAARVRRETQLGEARVVTLLREEHAALGTTIASEAESQLRFYTSLWGPIGPRTLGVVEFETRGNSYNWTSQGIIAMESGAFGGGVPVKTLAHEVAHLWWGQETCARGRGERFLTEGLAEFAAWRYVHSRQGAAAAEELAQEAEERWWTSVHETGVDTALFDVRFASKGYTELAYAKGPLALWKLQQQLGPERMDEVLRAYRELSPQGGPDSADLFLAALRERSGGTAVDLSALEQPGHVHLELADVAFEGAGARGRVQLARCPEGVAAPRILGVTLAAYGEASVQRESVGPDTRFEIRAAGPIQALCLEPVGVLAGLESTTALASGIGFVSSEPAAGARGLALGPFVARLRFGTPLAELAEGFAKQLSQTNVRNALAEEHGILSVRSAALEDGGRTLALEIADTSPETEHVLVLPAGLRTARGLPLPALRVSFTTRDAGGAPRPRIVSSDPPEGARDVPAGLKELRIVFSEPMRLGRGFKKGLVADLEDEGWAYPSLRESRWEDPRTLIWELDRPLEPGKRYGLPFAELYKSELGVGMERFDLHFETAR